MVHWFVVSSYASGNFTEERVKNSVTLLQRVPPARFAVLHRFTLLFEEAIRAQLDQMEYQAAGVNVCFDLRYFAGMFCSILQLPVSTQFVIAHILIICLLYYVHLSTKHCLTLFFVLS